MELTLGLVRLASSHLSRPKALRSQLLTHTHIPAPSLVAKKRPFGPPLAPRRLWGWPPGPWNFHFRNLRLPFSKGEGVGALGLEEGREEGKAPQVV